MFVKILGILQTDVLREITIETCHQTKLWNLEIVVLIHWKNKSIVSTCRFNKSFQDLWERMEVLFKM